MKSRLRKSKRDTRTSPKGPPAARRRRVLLAEDDSEMRDLLAWSLHDAGYEVETAADGTNLRDRLWTHLLDPGAEPLDLVISDVRMPGDSGLGVIKDLIEFERLPPTILITAFGDEGIHREAEDIGVLLLDKPFDIDELLERARKILKQAS